MAKIHDPSITQQIFAEHLPDAHMVLLTSSTKMGSWWGMGGSDCIFALETGIKVKINA